MSLIEQHNNSSNFDLFVDTSTFHAELIFKGSVTLEIINNAYLKLIGHPLFRKDMNACYDYTDAIIETNICELEEHSEFVSHYASHRGASYKLAMVSNETLNTAILNVYKLRICTNNVEAKIFSSKKQALNWLNL